MALSRYNRSPFGFDDLLVPFFDHDPFQDLLMPVLPNFPRTNEMTLLRSSPGYEINEKEGKCMISLDLPGVKRSDMNVDLENDGKIVHIHGGRKMVEGGKTTETKFSKRFTIGENIDIEKMTANLNDGVLTLTAPIKKKEEPQPKRIAIQEGSMEVDGK